MKKNEEIIKIILSLILFLISYILPKYEIYFLVISYVIISYNLYINAIKDLFKGEIFNENLLMIIATIGAFIIKSYHEAVVVILLFQIGEFLSDLSVDHSKQKIISLMNLKSDYVNLKSGNDIKKVDIKSVKVGDIFVVKPGEKIPLDGIILEGTSSVDTSSLTGESIPKIIKKQNLVLSGYINNDAILIIKATSIYETSTAYKIIDLIENSNEKKGQTEKFITRFSKVYTPIIVIGALLLVVIPVLLFNGNFDYWLYKALVFLVTSCPCALVISVPLSYFCGIGKSSHNGILIKGSNIIDSLSVVKNIAFDKTGTLTEGTFEVVDIYSKNLSKKELLSLAASVEYFSIHPIAKAIVKKCGKKIDSKSVQDYREVSGRGVSCKINGKKVLIGNKSFMNDNEVKVENINKIGNISYISIDNKYEGYIIVSDKIKENASITVKKLNNLGINNITILSGDHHKIVEAVAKKLQIKQYNSELLPIDKVKRIELLKHEGTTLFVGDGMNDAPVMKMADVSISMGEVGSDAAIETSDVVIMTDDLEKIPHVIQIARLVKNTAIYNIVFALIIKFLVLILAIFNITSIWMAVFADVGVTLISILNSLLIISKRIK